MTSRSTTLDALVEYELEHNPILIAFEQANHPLRTWLSGCNAFDALLLPCRAAIDTCQAAVLFIHHGSGTDDTHSPSSNKTVVIMPQLDLLLRSHLIRFDSAGLSAEFTTLSGHRGTFGDALDTVMRSGLIGKRSVLGHIEPKAASDSALGRGAKAAVPTPPLRSVSELNIFILDGFLVEPEVVLETVKQFRQALHDRAATPAQPSTSTATTTPTNSTAMTGSGAVTTATPSSKSGGPFSRFLGNVANTWIGGGASSQPSNAAPPPPGADSSAPQSSDKAASTSTTPSSSSSSKRRTATDQEIAIQYPEFQRLMLLPESAAVAKSLHTFVDHVLLHAGKEGATTSGQQSLQQHSAVNPVKEIRTFINQLTAQVQRLPAWKGKELIAREGAEKYICSKVYSKLFATSWSEKQKDATLKRKLSLLNPVVNASHLDGLEGVEDAPEWTEAVAQLRLMNEFRSPRDKMDCAYKASAALQRCILYVRGRGKPKGDDADKTPPKAGVQQAKKHEGDASDSNADGEHSCHGSATTSPVAAVPPSRNGSVAGLPGGLNLGGADDYLPCLILCVLRANPDSLCSNLTYIDHYRDKNLMEMSGEYTLTSLQSCAEFWLTCQAAHLKMSEDEFDTALGNVFAKPQGLRQSVTRRDSDAGHPAVPVDSTSLIDEIFSTHPASSFDASRPSPRATTGGSQHLRPYSSSSGGDAGGPTSSTDATEARLATANAKLRAAQTLVDRIGEALSQLGASGGSLPADTVSVDAAAFEALTVAQLRSFVTSAMRAREVESHLAKLLAELKHVLHE